MNFREWALPFYTILMQLAVGALIVLWILRWAVGRRFNPEEINRVLSNPLLIISFTVVVAMLSSHLHLSRPLQSFYAVRNFRSSWLSREIVFTVLFFLMLSAVLYFSRFKQEQHRLITTLGWLAVVLGLTVIYCMGKIYLLPTQLAWNSPFVIISFYVTTLLLGTMTIACLLLLDLKFVEIQRADDLEVHSRLARFALIRLSLAAFLIVAINIAVTYFQIGRFAQQGEITLQISLRLLFELYAPLFVMRLVLLVGAPIWMGYAVYRTDRLRLASQELMTPVYLSCLLILVAEILGRFLFYATHIRLGI